MSRLFDPENKFWNFIGKIADVTCMSFLSYGSMAAYLFHRQIYYWGLALWDPSDIGVKIGYLTLILLPIIFIMAYGIQKGYDKVITDCRQ